MRPRREAVLVAAVLALLVAAAPAHASFGVSDFKARVTDSADKDVDHAGTHPYFGITKFVFNQTLLGTPDGNVRNVRVDVPPGLISNPQATRQCTDQEFNSLS